MSCKNVDVWEHPKYTPFYDTLIGGRSFSTTGAVDLDDARDVPVLGEDDEKRFWEQLVVNMEVSR